MTTGVASLIASGTKLWLDSVDPDLIEKAVARGATGATSNPAIISGLIKSGRFDDEMISLFDRSNDEEIAWHLTDKLVSDAQKVFHPVWKKTRGNDGWVSFELDPLIEDPQRNMPHEDRVASYIESGKRFAEGYDNRMIKVPATPAGLDALEELAAAGVTLNVTLIFTDWQYARARASAWRGAQRGSSLDAFKSVYSIFISRIDVYTEKHIPGYSNAAQGQVGLVNVKRIWRDNENWWAEKSLPLKQEIIFASTGTKKPEDPKDKYVAALAGSDIQTNPPETIDATDESGTQYTRKVDVLPDPVVLDEIDARLDLNNMYDVLMSEGVKKFADPQKALLALIAEKRAALQPAG